LFLLDDSLGVLILIPDTDLTTRSFSAVCVVEPLFLAARQRCSLREAVLLSSAAATNKRSVRLGADIASGGGSVDVDKDVSLVVSSSFGVCSVVWRGVEEGVGSNLPLDGVAAAVAAASATSTSSSSTFEEDASRELICLLTKLVLALLLILPKGESSFCVTSKYESSIDSERSISLAPCD